MSQAPRPYSLPSRSTSVNGSVSHAWLVTGTTSVWPESAMPPTSAGPMVANRLAFCPSARRHAHAVDAMAAQITLDEFDDRDVGLVAGRVEGDEPRQQFLRRAELGGHLVLQFRLRVVCGLSSENAGTATSMRSPASVVIW